jgi:hypothetical protein
VIYRPNTQLSKASSVQTTRIVCADLPLCKEASTCSSVFDQLQDFFPKHRCGKIATNVWTMWTPVRTRSSIRQVAHSKFKRLDVSLHGPDVRATYMEIAYIWSTIQTTIPLVWMCKALIWKLRAAKVRPSERQGNTIRTRLKSGKNFNEILESRSHSYFSGRLMSTTWTAPRFIKPDAHFKLQPINRGP